MSEKSQSELNNNALAGSRKALFLKRTAIVFFVLVVLLSAIGLAPTSVKEVNNSVFSLFINNSDVKQAQNDLAGEKANNNVGVTATIPSVPPIRIVIPKIGTDVKILNPESTDSKTLDEALLLGAVRYPTSGDPESSRTIFLFGHSSYLPVVHNKAYRTFNEIQKLKAGDEITIYSSAKEYRYKVEKVQLITADEGFVNLAANDHKLVLATCDVFGKKEQRYVVTAGFVESFAIAK